MASPMMDGRPLNPREKAHFSLHISDRITKDDGSHGRYSSVKYNHKPSQTTSTRSTKLTPASPSSDRYTLRITDDKDGRGGTNSDVFTFTGQKTQLPKKNSYILLFDTTTQRATLKPLDSAYTFNLTKKNRDDISSSHPKIYPRKPKDEAATTAGHDTPSGIASDDLFDDDKAGNKADADYGEDPDPANPYDFRHFLKMENKEKRSGEESEYPSPGSPDTRPTGTGSARSTPLMPARRLAAGTAPTNKARTSQTAAPKPKRVRKSPEADPLVSRPKASTKKSQTATPTVRLDRRASTYPKPETKSGKKTGKSAQSSRIKSAEIVHSSDDSDIDAEGELASPAHIHHVHRPDSSSDEDQDQKDEDGDIAMGSGSGGLEIEVPDAHPDGDVNSRPRHNALASLGLGQNLGLGGLSHLRSPSAGPISLASAANSVEGSPNPSYRNPHATQNDDVIDFGSMGGANDSDEDGDDADAEGEEEEVEDRDVEPMDLGPPAQQNGGRKMSASGGAVVMDEDEEDPLYKEMMEGLAGESSEESEEE